VTREYVQKLQDESVQDSCNTSVYSR